MRRTPYHINGIFRITDTLLRCGLCTVLYGKLGHQRQRLSLKSQFEAIHSFLEEYSILTRIRQQMAVCSSEARQCFDRPDPEIQGRQAGTLKLSAGLVTRLRNTAL